MPDRPLPLGGDPRGTGCGTGCRPGQRSAAGIRCPRDLVLTLPSPGVRRSAGARHQHRCNRICSCGIPYSVLQINICNSGHTDCYTGEATARAGDLINARSPSVVTVNEMCASDGEPIRERTGYAGVFTQSGTQTCTNGSAYGNALLFPAGTSVGMPYRFTYNAQSDHTEHRTLTCVPAAGITACVTHLSPSVSSPTRPLR